MLDAEEGLTVCGFLLSLETLQSKHSLSFILCNSKYLLRSL